MIKLPDGHLYSWQGLGDFWEFVEKARSRLNLLAARTTKKKNVKNPNLDLLADAVAEVQQQPDASSEVHCL